MTREALLARTLVELADNLVDDFDIVDLLTTLSDRCVEVLDIAAAGIMLVAPDGDLRVMTSSSEAMRVVELFELQSQEGPCLDCYRSGEAVVNHDLASADTRWPVFAPVALDAGFRSADAVPMRLRSQIIGALNLFRSEPGALDDRDVIVAQALADVATIALLQHRTAAAAEVVNDQLMVALNSRILIEQAKGIIAERHHVDMEQAFSRLRTHARNRNQLLSDSRLQRRPRHAGPGLIRRRGVRTPGGQRTSNRSMICSFASVNSSNESSSLANRSCSTARSASALASASPSATGATRSAASLLRCSLRANFAAAFSRRTFSRCCFWNRAWLTSECSPDAQASVLPALVAMATAGSRCGSPGTPSDVRNRLSALVVASSSRPAFMISSTEGSRSRRSAKISKAIRFGGLRSSGDSVVR